MNEASENSIRMIGVGNEMRGDDAVGLRVVEELGRLGVPAIACNGDGAALIELWRDVATVVVVDAMRSGAAPGTVRRIDTSHEPLDAVRLRGSSHRFGIVEAIETSRALGILPPHCVVYGIEGETFDIGAPLSAAVANAAQTLAANLAATHFPRSQDRRCS